VEHKVLYIVAISRYVCNEVRGDLPVQYAVCHSIWIWKNMWRGEWNRS